MLLSHSRVLLGLVMLAEFVVMSGLMVVMRGRMMMAGGLVAAAYTDLLQGVMIIVLSVLLVPAGLQSVGGLAGLHDKLPPAMFSITAPQGAREGDLGFVVTMSLLGLVGFVVQPHVMTATGSGKTETEARVGMVYGNFQLDLDQAPHPIDASSGLIIGGSVPLPLGGVLRDRLPFSEVPIKLYLRTRGQGDQRDEIESPADAEA